MNHNFLPLLNKAGVDLMIGADLHEYFYHPAGTMNNAFPILVNDSESRQTASRGSTSGSSAATSMLPFMTRPATSSSRPAIFP